MLKRLTSPFREFGWFAGLLYGIHQALQRVSPSLHLHLYELLVQPIPGAPLLPGKLAKAYEFREIAKGDPEIALMPARPDIKESRFGQQAVCIGTFLKNELVGYLWLSFHTYEEDEVRCTFVLPDDGQSVFDFDLYIVPKYRMGLAFAAVWDGASQYLRQRGVRYSFSRLTRVNIASRRAHARLGTRCVGRMIVFVAGTFEFMLSSVPPYIHLSFRRKNRVRLKLRNVIPQTPTAGQEVPAFQAGQ